MYTRGQFAMMGNIGRKALRLYHEEGLLVPVYTNEENGYHYYDEKQLVILEKIKQFRKIGLSLFEIKQIMEGKAEETEIVQSKISETDQLLKELKEHQSEKNPRQTEVSAGEIDIRPFERCICIFICENVERENLGRSVGKLYERAAREELQIASSHFAVFSDLDDEERFSMRTCLPVLNYTGLDAIEVYEEKCLHMHFTGGFSKIRQTHQCLRRHAEESGIELAERVYEVYNKDMSADVYYVMR